MTFTRLARHCILHRDPDGSTRIHLGAGEALRVGPGHAALLDSLATGIPDDEWHRRTRDDPHVTSIQLALHDLTLLEHGLPSRYLEVRVIPIANAPIGSPLSRETWRRWCVLVLTAAAAMAAASASAALPPAQLPAPWWAWLMLPFILAATVLLHESSHYLVARLQGMPASVRVYQDGQLQACCVIEPGSAPGAHARLLRVLAAGPLADCALLAISIVLTRTDVPYPIAGVILLCTLAGLAMNLLPGRRSDHGRMLTMTPYAGPLHRTLAWLVSVLAGGLALLQFARLTGLTPFDPR